MTALQTSEVELDKMTLEEAVAHYGVKGMKWGVRKDDQSKPRSERRQRYDELRNRAPERMTVKTRNGVTVNVDEVRETKLASFIRSFRKTATDKVGAPRHFSLSVDGKSVGVASFWWSSPDEVYLNWLSVNRSEQGKGYGTATFDAAVQHAKKGGAKKLTLEVPGNAPNARHIYEKQGFVAGKQVSPSGDIWGGLTEMSLDLTKKTIAHDALGESDELELAFLETFGELPEDLETADDTPDDLAHYGVKGMKWGVRRPVGPNGLVQKTSTKKGPSEQGKAGGTTSGGGKPVVKVRTIERDAEEMTREELRVAVERLRLEKEYARLNQELNPAKAALKNELLSTTGQIAKTVAVEVAKQALKEVASNAVRKKTGLKLGQN